MPKSKKFYTTIQEPKKFRKHLLESSKEVIQILKENQARKEMRAKKEEKVEELKYHFEELRNLMDRLDEFLPEDSMEELDELLPEEPHSTVEETTEESDDEHEEEPEPEEQGEESLETSDEESDDEHEEPEHEEEPEPEEKTEMDRLDNALKSIEEKLQGL